MRGKNVPLAHGTTSHRLMLVAGVTLARPGLCRSRGLDSDDLVLRGACWYRYHQLLAEIASERLRHSQSVAIRLNDDFHCWNVERGVGLRLFRSQDVSSVAPAFASIEYQVSSITRYEVKKWSGCSCLELPLLRIKRLLRWRLLHSLNSHTLRITIARSYSISSPTLIRLYSPHSLCIY